MKRAKKITAADLIAAALAMKEPVSYSREQFAWIMKSRIAERQGKLSALKALEKHHKGGRRVSAAGKFARQFISNNKGKPLLGLYDRYLLACASRGSKAIGRRQFGKLCCA